jgi:hypothetical protein
VGKDGEGGARIKGVEEGERLTRCGIERIDSGP